MDDIYMIAYTTDGYGCSDHPDCNMAYSRVEVMVIGKDNAMRYFERTAAEAKLDDSEILRGSVSLVRCRVDEHGIVVPAE